MKLKKSQVLVRINMNHSDKMVFQKITEAPVGTSAMIMSDSISDPDY